MISGYLGPAPSSTGPSDVRQSLRRPERARLRGHDRGVRVGPPGLHQRHLSDRVATVSAMANSSDSSTPPPRHPCCRSMRPPTRCTTWSPTCPAWDNSAPSARRQVARRGHRTRGRCPLQGHQQAGPGALVDGQPGGSRRAGQDFAFETDGSGARWTYRFESATAKPWSPNRVRCSRPGRSRPPSSPSSCSGAPRPTTKK